MFVRNGESLGSVLHSAVPGDDPEPQTADPTHPDETEQEADQNAPVESERPKDHDNKPDWVEYAVSRGADRDEAEGLTKAELIELYGGEE